MAGPDGLATGSQGQPQRHARHCPDALLPSATGDHAYFAYLHVDDAHALHAEWVQRGAVVLHPPIDRDWGMREFAVTTPDGHRLMVGEILPP